MQIKQQIYFLNLLPDDFFKNRIPYLATEFQSGGNSSVLATEFLYSFFGVMFIGSWGEISYKGLD